MFKKAKAKQAIIQAITKDKFTSISINPKDKEYNLIFFNKEI